MLDRRIAALERAAAGHWRAAETEWLGDWLLRADGGFTGRANSVLPLGDPGLALGAAVDVVSAWYAARGLPAMFAVPGADGAAPGELDTELAARGWTVRADAAYVMTAAAASVAAAAVPGAGGAEVEFLDRPDASWLDRYHYRGRDLPPAALRLLLSAPEQAFARVLADGETAAVGRVSVADGWAGITAVDVDPRWRRSGLGTAVTRALAAEGARRGADRVFLQVTVDNDAARGLYRRCGFADSHRYHYRVAPAISGLS